jgi:hypothetical protein
MTLVGVSWAGIAGRDVHLLPGLASPQLSRFLQADELVGTTVTQQPLHRLPNIDITFSGGPGNGITVHTKTGEVTVDSPLPAGPFPRSFVVTASVSQSGGTPVTTQIRVHVHDAMTALWLTPARLTVRQGAHGVRMSVLASFQDGTTGDITNWSPPEPPIIGVEWTYVHAVGAEPPALQWEPPTGTPVAVDAVTGVLASTAETGQSSITVRFQDRSATAIASGGPPWSTPVLLTKVRGPGPEKLNVVPNVLFLPDGFREHEKELFNQIVRRLVHTLSKSPHTRPFADFDSSINYFSAWVPSRDPGISVLQELDQEVLPSGEIRGHPVPPVDLTPGGRMLPNERDSAFHMAYGGRPELHSDDDDRTISVHPLRLSDVDFEAFLDALRISPEVPLVESPWSKGKDRDHVVVLCRSNRSGGTNSSRGSDGAHRGKVLAVSLDMLPYHRLRLAFPFGYELVNEPVGCGCNFDTWLTIAHELAHSWDIGDEYTEFNTEPGPEVLADVATEANLQQRSELLDANSKLVPTNIKWGKWPRIEAAAVLLGPPEVQDGLIKLRVDVAGGGFGDFRAQDYVRLRTRPLALSKGTSELYRIIAIRPLESELHLVAVTAIEPDLATKYPTNSIVLRPVRALGEDLTLITAAVRDRITQTHNPLNAAPEAAANRPCANAELDVPTRALNFPDSTAPSPPRWSAYTIGLYENGGRYNCGIYRPTGICLMTRYMHRDTPDKSLRAYQFCLVCRYAMVDTVNPSLHRRIEEQYQARYERGTE